MQYSGNEEGGGIGGGARNARGLGFFYRGTLRRNQFDGDGEGRKRSDPVDRHRQVCHVKRNEVSHVPIEWVNNLVPGLCCRKAGRDE